VADNRLLDKPRQEGPRGRARGSGRGRGRGRGQSLANQNQTLQEEMALVHAEIAALRGNTATTGQD